VVSLINSEMRNASSLGACIYNTETSLIRAQEDADKEAALPGHRGRARWLRTYNQLHIRHKTEFLARINSKAIVVMLVVDTKPAILPNFHNDHMDALKRQLRLAYNPPVVGREGHHHALHITDDPSEVGAMLRCLGMPPPRPAAILARAASVRAVRGALRLRSYQTSRGTTSDGRARKGPAVERAFKTGLEALSSQGCMHGAPGHWADHGPCVEDVRHDCVLRAVSDAIVLKGGDRAVWPMGAKQSSDVDILVSNATDAVACLASRFKHARVVSATRSNEEDPPPTQLRAEEQPRPLRGLGYLRFAVYFAQPPPSRSILVQFNIYGSSHSSPAARAPSTWAERMRRRSVWVLSPAGFAYRRLSDADEAIFRNVSFEPQPQLSWRRLS